MDNAVPGVGAIIRYTFDDPYLVWEALSAAGSIISGGNRRFPDGNKRLALLGDKVIQLALAEDWYNGEGTRGTLTIIRLLEFFCLPDGLLAIFTRLINNTASNNNLSMTGVSHNLDAFVNRALALRFDAVSPATMATTVEAIVGAVYLDSTSLQVVKDVLQTLGLTAASLG
ncbi:MAG: hypothetical protein Q9216_001988 [Gyalolechia sp. 2 TL-2023]